MCKVRLVNDDKQFIFDSVVGLLNTIFILDEPKKMENVESIPVEKKSKRKFVVPTGWITLIEFADKYKFICESSAYRKCELAFRTEEGKSKIIFIKGRTRVPHIHVEPEFMLKFIIENTKSRCFSSFKRWLAFCPDLQELYKSASLKYEIKVA